MRSGLQDIIRVGLEDVADTFGITDDLFPQVASIIVKSEPLQEIIQARNKIDDWHDSTPLGGPGTILNGFALFALAWYYGMPKILETGVSGGFYTAFLMEALRTDQQGKRRPDSAGSQLISLEISDDKREVGKLLPNSLRAEINWNLVLGEDSVGWMKKNSKEINDCNFYCHDSLHTVPHMLKELIEFKKCELEEFFIYIDDQNTDNFWQKALQTNAFHKPGYSFKYISGNESRLRGHLGGFLKYNKVA